MTITTTTSVTLVGVTASTTPNNMQVTATVGSSAVGSMTFTVTGPINGAIPVNFTQTSVSDAGNGDLHFTYTWDSSSGNRADLSACTIGEIVTYQGSADPFPFPSPPFPPDAYPNPTIINGAATNPGVADDNKLTPSTTFVKPYSASSFTATQYIRFKCSTYQGGAYVNLRGPLPIVRSVSPNGSGGWEFTVTKSGATAIINPLP